MSIFNGKRLDKKTFKMDEDIKGKLRNGWYSDVYFNNVTWILSRLSKESYIFGNNESDLDGVIDVRDVEIGDIEIEMQIFTSRPGKSVIAGVDEAIEILRECTGYYDDENNFINTFNNLEVEAVQDGSITIFEGDKMNVQPVIKIRGRYRDFAHLETPYLGVLGEPTRIATNVYNIIKAANGKPVLFFPARFAHYKLQGIHGYAYWLAIQRYKKDFGAEANPFVSTAEQGDWWGGKGAGTIPHSSIASFLGNTAETMMQFSRIMPVDVPRIVLNDFHNDTVADTLKTMDSMWNKYWELHKEGKIEEARKYKLYGVRPDTSGSMRDVSIEPLGDRKLDNGVTPRLVHILREAMNERWKVWLEKVESNDYDEMKRVAKKWCQDIKISVTGGFNVERIKRFEAINAPVDIYGVGSSCLENSSKTGANNDFTADIVRVKIKGKWYDLAKVGRKACNNSMLEKVQ
ncbi:nicotinate phosphoribosyltransferase [Sporosalibacterium faouarense]|uniref:nicotinate phosphoribosyltransferase n=1 Tax=Sporosalibacterium faouarense TaxID=516123 RepID=UPI00141CC3A6|nr:nicotinate phosphoribosyltransferase [Sporosalibacterium faouarense]MTI48051.1 nicotinate phosphoribosyltransferase [Bacillota bacterium]